MNITASNALFSDEPTGYRIRVHDRPRVVYARSDHEGNFVRFVAYRTPQEIKAAQKRYAPAKVGITRSYEVQPWEIGL